MEGVEHTIDCLQPAALGLRIGDDHAKVLARPDRCGVEAGGGKPSDLVVYGARLVARAVAQELSKSAGVLDPDRLRGGPQWQRRGPL